MPDGKNQRDFFEQGNIRILDAQGENESRELEFSFSSETPVQRSFGLEILDHTEGCADLSRLQAGGGGTVLFNHDRDRIVGAPIEARIESGRGRVRMRFARTAFAEEALQLVRDGILTGVSFGYVVDAWEEVREGHRSADGRFAGPAMIGRSWYPYEVSLVTIPADATVGVGRVMEAAAGRRALIRRIYEFNRNLVEIGGQRNA